ncbi:MAG TPA: Fe-S cluster assembly ATPase SufC, partial [Acidimicrobiaceae bacterium]|nr:Fe-S cluster assembly ATPase SufC [Acidimicrobiaceae bacterium]
PGYQVDNGAATLEGSPLLELELYERAQLGVFLAFQYPVEIPGVSNMEFLKASIDSLARARGEEQPNTAQFMRQVRELASSLDLDPAFLKRGVNEGFSGGEKKRNEVLQLAILEPEFAILDETDSGLDIDALKVVANGVREVHQEKPEMGVLLITHYQRLLSELNPDYVHILFDGRIVESGGPELAERLEKEGYERFES